MGHDIPVHVTPLLLGIPPDDGERSRGEIHGLLGRGPIEAR